MNKLSKEEADYINSIIDMNMEKSLQSIIDEKGDDIAKEKKCNK